jgi:hypothetical protein
MSGNEFGETEEMSINLEEEEKYYLEGFEDGTGTLKALVAERDEARKHEAAAYERQRRFEEFMSTSQKHWENSEARKALGQEKSVTTDGEIPQTPPHP